MVIFLWQNIGLKECLHLTLSMKVCHIGFSRYPGIGSVAMYEYSRNLARLGIDVQVIAAGETDTKEKEIDGVTVLFIKSSSVKNLSMYPFLFLVRVYRYLKRVPDSAYDIVHVYHFPGSSSFPFLLRGKGKKWIFFTTSGPIRGGVTSRIGWSIQSAESRLFDHIILRDKSHTSPFSYTKDITIVPIGADFNRFSPGKSHMRDRYSVDPDEFLFLYVGNLHPARRIETVIEALKMVNEKREAKLMLVGNGGTKRLKKYAKDLKVSSQVIFTGSIPYEEIPLYMRCCNVFLSYVPVTPEFDIQPPLKTVEALACGLPVIATDTLGNRRFVNHRENGFLSGDDVLSVRNSMVTLMENESLRKELKKNARPSAQTYDWETIVRDKLLPAYEKLI